MKKFISIIAIAGLLLCTGISASAQYTPNWAHPSGSFVNGSFPGWYTVTDSFPSGSISYNDSIWVNLGNGYATSSTNSLNSVTFQFDILKVAGSPTVTAACYVASDIHGIYGPFSGPAYSTSPIATFTVVPTSLTVPVVPAPYVVTGNPYAKYLWVISPSASSTVGCVGSVLIR